jgi:hypothetical protein
MLLSLESVLRKPETLFLSLLIAADQLKEVPYIMHRRPWRRLSPRCIFKVSILKLEGRLSSPPQFPPFKIRHGAWFRVSAYTSIFPASPLRNCRHRPGLGVFHCFLQRLPPSHRSLSWPKVGGSIEILVGLSRIHQRSLPFRCTG